MAPQKRDVLLRNALDSGIAAAFRAPSNCLCLTDVATTAPSSAFPGGSDCGRASYPPLHRKSRLPLAHLEAEEPERLGRAFEERF
jgi:hypothetical protein